MKQGIVLEMDNINAVIMTSDGQFLSIPAKASWQIGETVTISEFDQKLNNQNDKNKYKKDFMKNNRRILVAIVASLLLFLMPFSLISEASTYVTLDINPSIEFEIKDDKVINMRALNSDGEKLISQFNSENNLSPNKSNDIYSVTSLILAEAGKMGYLKANEKNIIMIGISESKDFKSIEYEQFIQSKLSEINLEAQVVVLSATSNEKKIADEKGISLGRQLLLEKEKAEGILISDEQITTESIKNIFSAIEEEKRKNSSNKYNDKINEDVEKREKVEDKEEDEIDNDSSRGKNDKEKDSTKQEEKKNNEEKKNKVEDKNELENKEQEKEQENENDEQTKVEDKEDQTQQEENNEENNQDQQKEETNQDNESKENEQDNPTDENNQDNETEENDQDTESEDNDHDDVEENEENKN